MPPRRGGQASHMPPALGPLLVSTIQVDQLQGMTGGCSKDDVTTQIQAAIEGSPFAELFGTVSKIETGYRTWAATQGAFSANAG